MRRLAPQSPGEGGERKGPGKLPLPSSLSAEAHLSPNPGACRTRAYSPPLQPCPGH